MKGFIFSIILRYCYSCCQKWIMILISSLFSCIYGRIIYRKTNLGTIQENQLLYVRNMIELELQGSMDLFGANGIISTNNDFSWS